MPAPFDSSLVRMSSPDRQPVSETPPSAAPLPAALRPDGREPRSRADRLLMLGILTAISLAVTIPTLVVTGIFGQRPRPKTPPAAQATPAPGDGLLSSLQRSADQLLPAPQSLGPDPIIVPVRPEHIAARVEKVAHQAAQFGGTTTEGLTDANGRHLFVDLPASQTAAFRLAVTTKSSVDAAIPAPVAAASPAATAASLDHVEVIIRTVADDE